MWLNTEPNCKVDIYFHGSISLPTPIFYPVNCLFLESLLCCIFLPGTIYNFPNTKHMHTSVLTNEFLVPFQNLKPDESKWS